MREHGRTRLLEARARLAEGERERAARIMESLVVEDLAEGDTVLGEVGTRCIRAPHSPRISTSG